jgi:hypothetical protein
MDAALFQCRSVAPTSSGTTASAATPATAGAESASATRTSSASSASTRVSNFTTLLHSKQYLP